MKLSVCSFHAPDLALSGLNQEMFLPPKYMLFALLVALSRICLASLPCRPPALNA